MTHINLAAQVGVVAQLSHTILYVRGVEQAEAVLDQRTSTQTPPLVLTIDIVIASFNAASTG